MWEYYRKIVPYKSSQELIKILNEMGEMGWEIIYYNEVIPISVNEKNTAIILAKRMNQYEKKS